MIIQKNQEATMRSLFMNAENSSARKAFVLNRFFTITMITFFVTIICSSQNVWAACSISSPSGQSIKRADALEILLSSTSVCPSDVFRFRQLLKQAGLKIETSMVANRGFHNPAQGSFSMFEMVTGQLKSKESTLIINHGDFFFGHFTAVNPDGYLVADQNPEKGSLMIEALAWDPEKEVFNFYELRGDGEKGRWFYRGDSADILADNEFLHRQPDPQHPQFGNRLRCSACHDAGGPIMKELYSPQNDWWEPTRRLDFGGRKPDVSLREILETLVPSDRLAKSVILGIKKLNELNESKTFYRKKSSLSLQEQFRPLFCPVELNFASDKISNDEKRNEIIIPIEFFVDSRLFPADARKGITISRRDYEATLDAFGSHFPETNLKDSDHAWLTPVKAKSDKMAIDNLIQRRIIDKEFMAAVLEVDMTNPIFSQARCRLLRFLPNTKTSDWQTVFIKNLSQSQDIAAKQLVKNLTDTNRTITFYQQKAERFLKACRIKLKSSQNVEKMVRLLAQRRAEIRASEISANPRGQILEPGFRVIFPENKITSLPGKLTLTSECDVVESG